MQRRLQYGGLGAVLPVEPHQHQHQNREDHHNQPGALGELRDREDGHHTRRQDARRQVDHQLVAPAGPTMGQLVFGHAVAGHRERGEHAHREHRHQRVDRASRGDQKRHRERGQQDDGIGEHQPMTALHQRPWQEAVLGNKVSQRRKTVEAGIGTVVQDGRARRLQQEVTRRCRSVRGRRPPGRSRRASTDIRRKTERNEWRSQARPHRPTTAQES